MLRAGSSASSAALAVPLRAGSPMAILLLVPPGGIDDGVVARHARLRDRIVAWWRAASLERELARGVAPESHAALALRAQALVALAVRIGLAHQLQRIVRDARIGHRSLSAKIPTRRREVLAAAHELDALAERLLASGPVSAHGVAQVRVLLTDGRGPLYDHRATQQLRIIVARALQDLDGTWGPSRVTLR
jgi:hypothetical protein